MTFSTTYSHNCMCDRCIVTRGTIYISISPTVRGTTCTGVLYDYLDYYPVSNTYPKYILPPKNWKWYDIFRSPDLQVPNRIVETDGYRDNQIKPFTGISKTQRRKYKRKRYIESLTRR